MFLPNRLFLSKSFGKNIQDAEGFSIRFEYDETQVLYEGFDSGGVLPNAQVLSVPGTNPTAIEIWIASFGGKAAADSGPVGEYSVSHYGHVFGYNASTHAC